MGWIWTGDQHPTKELSFPYFYSEHLSAWCNIQFLGNGLAQTLSSGNWVLYKYELDNSTVTYTSSEFIQLLEALKIEAERNEFQSLLNSKNDIASVLQVIRDSSFFTSDEKDQIELQLLFTGQSSVLSNAGITLNL